MLFKQTNKMRLTFGCFHLRSGPSVSPASLCTIVEVFLLSNSFKLATLTAKQVIQPHKPYSFV